MKKRIFNTFILILSSFFIFSFNTFAVENHPLNNYSYANYLNLYNLQFDNREIAQRYYNFLLDNDLHDLLFNDLNFEGTLTSNKDSLINNYKADYFISLLGLPTDGLNHYDLNNGINFVYYGEIAQVSYQSPYDIRFYLSNNGSYYRFKAIIDNNNIKKISVNLKVFEDGTFTLSRNSSNFSDIDLNLRRSDVLQLFGAFYQSNMVVDYNENSPLSPFSFTGFQFYGDDLIYSSSEVNYLSKEYFDSHLVFGPGIPLYPGNAYFTNTFDFGVPYTSDFKYLFASSDGLCYFAPTNKFLSNYSSSSTNSNLYLYFRSNAPTMKDYEVGTLNLFIGYNKDSFTGSYMDKFDSGLVSKYSFTLNDNREVISFKPDLPSNDSILRFRYTPITYSQFKTAIIYYNPDYFNVSCTADGSNVSIINYNGDVITFSDTLRDDSSSNWFDSILELVSKFFDSLSSFFVYVVNGIGSLFSIFGSFFIFVGSTISLFYSCLPQIVVDTLNLILVLGGIVLLFRLFNNF